MLSAESKRVWTVAEAKARLSEILRLAEEEGPQRIGKRKSFIVVPASSGRKRHSPASIWANGWWRTLLAART